MIFLLCVGCAILRVVCVAYSIQNSMCPALIQIIFFLHLFHSLSIPFPIDSLRSSSSSDVHHCFPSFLPSLLIFLNIRWDKSLGGRRIALFHFPAKDESELRLVVGDELQLRLDAGAARLYGE